MIALARGELLKLRSTRTALGLFIAAVVVSLLPAVLIMILVPRDGLSDGGATVAPLASRWFPSSPWSSGSSA